MPNWNQVQNEIRELQAQRNRDAREAGDTVRRGYLAQLHDHTGRNIIAYYSGWLSKPDVAQTEINDEDMNGFMMAVHQLDRTKGLDLILHTPGGGLAATEAIVSYLRKMFGNDIRAIVPQLAMSAGTVIACACRSIVMAKHSSLGPIDPHLSGVPAAGIVDEFQRAFDEVKNDPARASLWHAIISQYPPTFLSQCENAIDWAREFATDQLIRVMFEGEADAQQKAEIIVASLTDYSGNKSHSRHIPFEECLNMGLKVEQLEQAGDPELQDLVLTIHHCFMNSMMNTQAFKMIENHLGVALVKQQAQLLVAPQPIS